MVSTSYCTNDILLKRLRNIFGSTVRIKTKVTYSALDSLSTVYITVDHHLFTFTTDNVSDFILNLPTIIYTDYPELLI